MYGGADRSEGAHGSGVGGNLVNGSGRGIIPTSSIDALRSSAYVQSDLNGVEMGQFGLAADGRYGL